MNEPLPKAFDQPLGAVAPRLSDCEEHDELSLFLTETLNRA